MKTKNRKIKTNTVIAMNKLFDDKILILTNADMNLESQGKEKILKNVSGSFQPVCKASYVLYYDEDTNELTVLKARKDIVLKHGMRK